MDSKSLRSNTMVDTNTIGINNLLSVEQTAKALGYTRGSFRNRMNGMKIPYQKICGKRYFRPEDIEAFINSKRVTFN